MRTAAGRHKHLPATDRDQDNPRMPIRFMDGPLRGEKHISIDGSVVRSGLYVRNIGGCQLRYRIERTTDGYGCIGRFISATAGGK